MHHEKCDGSGYPYGLKGDEIDKYSKIVTIDTPVPSLDRLTLVYAPDGSGKLLINTSELSNELSAYCDELFSHEDVQLMFQQESQRFEDAVTSDPDLQQLQNRLNTEKDAD